MLGGISSPRVPLEQGNDIDVGTFLLWTALSAVRGVGIAAKHHGIVVGVSRSASLSF
jgi:hypothetical protein